MYPKAVYHIEIFADEVLSDRMNSALAEHPDSAADSYGLSS